MKVIFVYSLSSGEILRENVKVGGNMDIICPQFEDDTSISSFVVYNVTKEVFDSCGKIDEGKS